MIGRIGTRIVFKTLPVPEAQTSRGDHERSPGIHDLPVMDASASPASLLWVPPAFTRALGEASLGLNGNHTAEPLLRLVLYPARTQTRPVRRCHMLTRDWPNSMLFELTRTGFQTFKTPLDARH
jgi:hypothetical protein